MDGTGDDQIYRDEESDSSKDTGNVEIEDDNTRDIDSDEEFLAFFEA